MKVMISQPMRGKSIEQIRSERADVVKRLEAQGHEILDSLINATGDKLNEPLYCLAKSLEIMSQCDGVCFVGDWKHARGCRIEHAVAIEYGLWVLEDVER